MNKLRRRIIVKVRNQKARKGKIVTVYQTDEVEVYDLQEMKGGFLLEQSCKQLFRRLKHKTGIKKLHSHLIRNTYCTMYLAAGGDIFSLRLSTGHESFEILNNYVQSI